VGKRDVGEPRRKMSRLAKNEGKITIGG